MPIATHTDRQDSDEDLVKVSTPDDSVKMENNHVSGQVTTKQSGSKRSIELKADVDLQGMMDDTVKRVREQSDRLQAAAMPYADKTRSFAERRPVLFTYIALFTLFSIIPVCCFIGFVVSATLFILGVAAVGICVSLLTAIVFSASILLPVLFFTSLISLTLLSFLVSLFLLHRLYLNVTAHTASQDGTTAATYDNLSKGVKAWIEETTDRVPSLPFDLSSVNLPSSSRWRSNGTIAPDGAATPRSAGDKVKESLNEEVKPQIKLEKQ